MAVQVTYGGEGTDLASVNEVVIFIASPGDLVQERNAVRRAADNVNSLFSATSTVRFTVTGWEQTQPGFGRPQEIINPLVDQCDIFIGLLSRRWGTPTGEFSSGFEEEYERAAQRTAEHGKPDLAIFFKAVPDDVLQDPGPELSGVLAFRRRLEKEHIALYREFSTVQDFELQVTLYLSHAITSLERPNISPPPEGTVDKTNAVEKVPTPLEPQIDDEARRQITSTLGAFYGLAGGTMGSGDADSMDADRLLLISMALQPEKISIPIHSMNRLYDKRAEYVLSVMEYRLIVWTIAENFRIRSDGYIHSFAPGFRLIEPAGAADDLEETLVSQILGPETDFSVAVGSLAILQAMKARPTGLWETNETGVGQASLAGDDVAVSGDALVDKWTHILETSQVESAALDYIHSVIRDTDAPVFDAVSERLSDVPVAAKLRALAAHVRGRLDEIVDLAATRYISGGSCFEQLILGALTRMTADQLAAVISGKALPDEVVYKAFELLARPRTPSSEEFSQLLGSKSEELIGLAFDAAEEGGTEASRNLLAALTQLKDEKDLGEYKGRWYALVKTEEELRAELSEPLTVVDAWSALSWLCGAEISDEAREILDTDCNSMLQPESLQGFSKQLSNYLKSTLRKAALSLLVRIPAKDRVPQDIERFRVELARNDWVTFSCAVDALASLGSSDDVPVLLPLRAKMYGGEKNRLLKKIVKLGGIDTARQLISDEDEETALAGALALAFDASVPLSELQQHLYNPHDAVRMEIWKGVEGRMSRSELEKYLDQYRSRPQGYYYDVVASIDAKLYLPR